MPGQNETSVTLHGCKIHVLRGGAGAPLVYLHGAGGGGLWLPFMEDMSRKFTVLAPEHPGFGRSDTPDWLDGIHDLAMFYLDFLAAEKLDDVHLVGSSLGGWLAAEMAMFDSSRLATLTVIGSAGLFVPGVKKNDIFLWSAEETARNLFHDQAMAETAAKLAVDPAGEDARMKNRYITARLAWQPRFYDPLLMKWLKRVKLPTLVLWGENDALMPKEYAAAFKKRLPQAQLEIIPECGHVPQLEKKDLFTERLTRFIAEAGR